MSGLRRWRHRAWQTAVIVVSVATATAVREAAPTAADVTAPFVHAFEWGATGHLRGLDVAVVDVDGAKSVDAAPYTRPSNGVWVVVTARLHATSEPAALRYAALYDAAGNEFQFSTRFQQDVLELAVEPGVDVVGQMAFELPTDAAPPLELRVARSGDTRLDVVAALALDVTTDDLAAWAVEDEPILISNRAVAP